MFEAIHSERAQTPASAVWALWANPKRWSEWNGQITEASLDGPLDVGAHATVKFKRGGRMVFEVLELEPERVLIDEARLIGARYGHERRVTPAGQGVEISHRIYIKGPLSAAYSLGFGRKRLRESVRDFVSKERALVEKGRRR